VRTGDAERARKWLAYRQTFSPLDPLASIGWNERAKLEGESQRAVEAEWRRRLDGAREVAAPALTAGRQLRPMAQSPQGAEK
jgi:hypothetical protein